jgi:hypothetical protein
VDTSGGHDAAADLVVGLPRAKPPRRAERSEAQRTTLREIGAFPFQIPQLFEVRLLAADPVPQCQVNGPQIRAAPAHHLDNDRVVQQHVAGHLHIFLADPEQLGQMLARISDQKRKARF